MKARGRRAGPWEASGVGAGSVLALGRRTQLLPETGDGTAPHVGSPYPGI